MKTGQKCQYVIQQRWWKIDSRGEIWQVQIRCAYGREALDNDDDEMQ